jgi:hypothetical protein
MRLNDMVANAFGGVAAKLTGATAKLKRNAILYAVCAVCAVAMLVLAVSASLLALEPYVGVVYARLILAGAFALVLISIILAIWLTGRPAVAAPAAQMNLHGQSQATQRSAQFAQLAMIVEAVMLGYSLARRR